MLAPSVVPRFSSPQLDELASWFGHGPALSLQTCLEITGLWLTLVVDTGPALLFLFGYHGTLHLASEVTALLPWLSSSAPDSPSSMEQPTSATL